MNRREALNLGLRLGTASLASAIILPNAGCATLMQLLCGVLKSPSVAVKSMKIQKATLSTLSTRFHLAIHNPNSFGFKLHGLEYGLSLMGASVAKGLAPKGIDLRPRAKADTQLDIDFDIAHTVSAILDMIDKGIVDYGLETVAHFRMQETDIPVPASYDGRMPMPKIPKFDISTFDVVSASLSGVKCRVAAALENHMDFDIPIDKFDFDVKLGGKSVLKNKTVKHTRLKAKKTTHVPFEFVVGLANLGISAAELATKPNLNWQVDTNLASGLLKLPFTQTGKVRLA